MALVSEQSLYNLAEHRDELQAYEGLAEELGAEPGTLVLAWLLTRPAVTTPIIGARTRNQLDNALHDVELSTWPEHPRRLDDISPVIRPRPRTCSRKLQQQTRDVAVPAVPIRDWLGMNGAQRGPFRHFASKGLGVRVPLAPLSHLVRGAFATPKKLSKAQAQQQSTATVREQVMARSGLRAAR
jgi:hypothetical protein